MPNLDQIQEHKRQLTLHKSINDLRTEVDKLKAKPAGVGGLSAPVTNSELATMAQSTIKGRGVGLGTGAPSDLSAAQARAVLNVASGADVTATAITALTTKATPVDTDAVVITDSAASDAPKRTTWLNIKATLLAYFSTLFAVLGGTAGGQTLNGGTASGDDLILASTTHGTKGDVIVASGTGFNVGNDALSVNTFHIGTTDGAQALARYAANANGPGLVLKKSRNASVGSHTIVQSGDEIGKVIFQGSDGAAYRTGAQIVAYVDGTPGASDMPGRLEIQVSPDGSVIPATAVYILSDKSMGVGISPLAMIHALQAILGDPVLTLQSTATNDDPREIVYQNRVATTDATVTTLHTFTVPTSNSYMVEVAVTARRTGGVSGSAEDGAGYILRGLYKNTAGTVAIIGSVAQTVVGESQAGWDATLDTTGATVRVRVTGAASNNITWHCTARVWLVGT